MVNSIIDYIKNEYDAIEERPWEGYPDNVTFKAKENKKWFALILPVSERALGISSSMKENDKVFVLNVKADSEFIYQITQTQGYFPGYHMNKEHWLSVLLDGSVPFEQICDRIAESYEMVTDTPTKRIYEAVKRIPSGKVATYAQVAAMAGNPKMSRAVGNALHKNPDPDNIPCFRVVNSKGELSGAFAFGGADEQANRLREDGIEVNRNKVDLSKYGIQTIL